MRNLISLLCALMLITAAFAGMETPTYTNAEVDPNLGPVAPTTTIDDQWDLLQVTNLGTVSGGDVLFLGCEFADGLWFITSAGASSASSTDNEVMVMNPDGSLNSFFAQPATSGWGWRDVAYDGTYLYASGNATVHAFDTAGNLVPAFNINGPENPNRALAYDPVSDHFWTANFSSPLYEFDRTGAVAWSGASGVTSVYGAAWDDWAPDGPWLWLFSQTGSPGTTITKFDPINHVVTAESYSIPLPPGYTTNIAGGMCSTDEWDPGLAVFGCVGQGSPDDNLMVLEYLPVGPLPDVSVTLTPYGTPIVIPATGGSFSFGISVTNNETGPVTFDIWTDATLPSGAPFGPIIGPINLTFAGGQSVSRNRSQSVPGGAPTGAYRYNAYVGYYPGTVFDSDSFSFTKSATGDGGAWIGDWSTSGESFETGLGVAAPAEFALLGNYPNPFNPTTTIDFALETANVVQLKVFDVSGREVATLVNGYRDAGSHSVSFDASGLASGVYIYRLTSGSQTAVSKMVLMK